MRIPLLLPLFAFLILACGPITTIQERPSETENTFPLNSEQAQQATGSSDIFIEKEKLNPGQERVNEPKKYPALSTNGTNQLSETKWEERLTSLEFRVLFRGWTERPGTGDLLHVEKKGVYVTAGCGLPVFSSETKFDSGTGWPSFWAPLNESNLIYKTDNLLGYPRTEVLSICGEHLGHVFDDGPKPTGKRYCMNSAALDFIAS